MTFILLIAWLLLTMFLLLSLLNFPFWYYSEILMLQVIDIKIALCDIYPDYYLIIIDNVLTAELLSLILLIILCDIYSVGYWDYWLWKFCVDTICAALPIEIFHSDNTLIYILISAVFWNLVWALIFCTAIYPSARTLWLWTFWLPIELIVWFCLVLYSNHNGTNNKIWTGL